MQGGLFGYHGAEDLIMVRTDKVLPRDVEITNETMETRKNQSTAMLSDFAASL
jgi:hypothetical protein